MSNTIFRVEVLGWGGVGWEILIYDSQLVDMALNLKVKLRNRPQQDLQTEGSQKYLLRIMHSYCHNQTNREMKISDWRPCYIITIGSDLALHGNSLPLFHSPCKPVIFIVPIIPLYSIVFRRVNSQLAVIAYMQPYVSKVIKLRRLHCHPV